MTSYRFAAAVLTLVAAASLPTTASAATRRRHGRSLNELIRIAWAQGEETALPSGTEKGLGISNAPVKVKFLWHGPASAKDPNDHVFNVVIRERGGRKTPGGIVLTVGTETPIEGGKIVDQRMYFASTVGELLGAVHVKGLSGHLVANRLSLDRDARAQLYRELDLWLSDTSLSPKAP